MTEEPRWRHRWILYVAGTAMIAVGLVQIVVQSASTRPVNFATFFVGSAVLHDAVLGPFVAAVGWLAVRRVVRWARPAVQSALIVSGALVLVAAPVLSGFGRRPDNSSTLPQNYWLNIAIALCAVWAVAAVALWRSRSRLPEASPRPSPPEATPRVLTVDR